MRYIISEKQYNTLTEIGRLSGHFNTQPIFDILEFFDSKLSSKQKTKSFFDYYGKTLGLDLPKNNQNKIDSINLFRDPRFMNRDELINKDALSGFVYYLTKKYIDLKQGVELEFFVGKEEDSDEKTFYFFDPYLKIFVGQIILKKHGIFGGKSFRVKMSATDDELIGTGYGIKMYLTLLDKFDFLSSDYSLFTGAYRIWKHVLPKYVNVWGVEETTLGEKYYKIDPQSKKSVKKYDYFVASKHPEIF